jgi:hypothetical protein
VVSHERFAKAIGIRLRIKFEPDKPMPAAAKRQAALELCEKRHEERK